MLHCEPSVRNIVRGHVHMTSAKFSGLFESPSPLNFTSFPLNADVISTWSLTALFYIRPVRRSYDVYLKETLILANGSRCCLTR